MYRKEAKIFAVSPVAWNFFHLKLFRDMLLFLTIPFVFGISLFDHSKSVTDSSGNIFNQLSALFVFGSSLFLAKVQRIPFRIVLFSIAPMAGFLLLALVSYFWSDYPSLSVRRSFHLAIEATSLVLIALAYAEKSDELLKRIFYIFAIITLADAASLVFPSISSSVIGFKGIHVHKNEAGAFFLCAIPLFAVGALYRDISSGRLAAALLLFIASGMLILTHSKTSITGVLAGVLMTLALRSVIQSKSYGGVAVMIPLYLALGSILLIYTSEVGIDAIAEKIYGDPTLTGRTDIWEFALTKFRAEPLHGVGYGAVWQAGTAIVQYLKDYNITIVNEAHNGYIDILAQLGVLGLVSLGIFMVVMFIRICRALVRYEAKNRIGIASYALYFLIVGVICNLSESSFFRTGISLWVLLVVISVCATARLGYQPMLIQRRRPIRAKFRTRTVRNFN